ncbi:MAG: hypothetical protein QNL43_04265 [Crocinitomicaceae bacterium]
MKKLSCLLLMLIAFSTHAQETLVGHSFFRDHDQNPAFADDKPSICDVGFQKDTTKASFLKKLKQHFFDQYLFEVHEKNVNLYISPVVNFQLGQNWLDSDGPSLFQNTRGLYVNGELLKNFSFSSAFVENQARFSEYETNFITNHGEFYPNASSIQQNGVVPGGGRTKPFKDGGYDYAYAIGSFLYKPIENLEIRVGNAPSFIGSGYRSLILSDNSYQAPSLDVKYSFLKKWSYGARRTRLFNLIRKNAFSTVEGYYQPKASALHYITYDVTPKVTIGFFENAIWSMGDTITEKPTGLYYAPISFLGLLQSENFSLYGFDATETVGEKVRFYQQFVLSGFKSQNMGFQLGVRFYDLLPNSMLQFEYNKVGTDLYTAEAPNMSYTHYNLPLAHPKGQGFDELIVRANISIKRFYGESKTVCYWLKNYNERILLPMNNESVEIEDVIVHQQFELGYRINPKINFCFFGRAVLRVSDIEPTQLLLHVGLSTNLFNSYNDY